MSDSYLQKYRKNPDFREQEKARHREYMKERRKNPDFRAQERVRSLDYYHKLRREVFNAYGGPVCACCEEDEYDFLTLDHINNDGAEQRKKYGSNPRVLQVIKQQGFPEGYQVLCANCNTSKGKTGICVHNR